uniref:Uncharacterized protein n=1 Tax=Candidatus Kentrum sp. DK TaxID=2126562 RepID=A0A450SC07_9GAMM|nr:MAG: hypothetical protein BECKDK2373B_GA0170837_102613 [Candidatus Kentron sp. DK]
MWFSEDVTFANTTCSCIPVTAAGGLLPSTLATPPLYAISPQHLTQPRECSSRIRNRFPVFFLASYPLKIKAGSKNSFSANLCVLCASAVAISSFLTAEAQSTQRFAEKKKKSKSEPQHTSAQRFGCGSAALRFTRKRYHDHASKKSQNSYGTPCKITFSK